MKHTPGPWDCTLGDKERGTTSAIHRHGRPDFLIAHVICESRNAIQREEDLGNAILIADAPAMRDTLNAIINDCDSFLNDEMDISPTDLIAAIKSAAKKFFD